MNALSAMAKTCGQANAPDFERLKYFSLRAERPLLQKTLERMQPPVCERARMPSQLDTVIFPDQ